MAIIDSAARSRITYLSGKLKCLAENIRKIEEGEITTETDPVFMASPAYTITEQNKTAWNNFTAKKTYIAVTLLTFSSLQLYTFTVNQPVRFVVTNDENKSQTNTVYYWNGDKLWWSAETLDQFQPILI